MRINIKLFFKVFSEIFEIKEPIYELGSRQEDFQTGWSDLRSFFKDKKYIGCDIRQGPGVDQIEDIHKLTLDDNSAGCILMSDMIEHVQDPFTALHQVYRKLSDGGLVAMTSTMVSAVHNAPYDFFRFSPAAFEALMKDFPIKVIGIHGNPNYPHTVFAIGLKKKEVTESLKKDLRQKVEKLGKKFQLLSYDEGVSGQMKKLIKLLKPIYNFPKFGRYFREEIIPQYYDFNHVKFWIPGIDHKDFENPGSSVRGELPP